MVIFVKFINVIGRFFKTLVTFVTALIVLILFLVLSFFTPLFSQAVLFILNQVALPVNATVTQEPSAIVVLGGGATRDKLNNITLTQFTLERLRLAEKIYTQKQLPIIVSGKEAPWMMRWLQRQGIFWVIPEKQSFNTCENAKFTAQSVQVKQVILVTDPYHMNRSRRQFALYGIATEPHIAPLSDLVSWYEPENNLKHSRRALYELLALIRDITRPQIDCEKSE